MLGKTPNKVYDSFLKARLGYQNPKRLKKAIAAQPKMYHGEMLQSTKLKIDSPNSEETLEDAEESRLKMRNKMVQLDYGKLNALYETFVPKKESYARKVSNPEEKTNSSKPVTSHSIPKTSKNRKRMRMLLQEECVESSNSVRRPQSKDTKSKNKVLKNTNVKRSSAHVRKVSSSVSIDSNKHEIMNFTVFQSNASVLNTKNINAVKDEYYAPSNFEVSNNSVANTLDNEDTPSPSSIIVENSDAPQMVTSSEEQITQESSNPVLETHFDISR
ncbi:hypothetical protein Tco_0386663 [Tanacetum coccineum]